MVPSVVTARLFKNSKVNSAVLVGTSLSSLWGSEWDKLLARDKDGALRKIMMDTLDGDFQAFKANDGAYVRKHFFGRDPRTLEMGVAHERRRNLVFKTRRS